MSVSSPSFRHFLGVALAALAMTFFAGCGGNSSSSSDPPQVAKTAVVIGKVTLPNTLKAAGDPIEVRVVGADPPITTMVGTDGTFTLRGLPEGGFTLAFFQGTTAVGTLNFTQVAANQQITITIQLVENDVVLVDEDRRGIGHAGIELEGRVENVIGLNVGPTSDSTFVIAGRTVIARPGVTAIREGITAKTVQDVTVGKQVHVKGTTIEGSTSILAYEIKLQNPTTSDPTTGEKQVTICHIPPGNPSKKNTITIGSSAWPAHQAHGDTEGACAP
jgi:hypothetical protein